MTEIDRYVYCKQNRQASMKWNMKNISNITISLEKGSNDQSQEVSFNVEWTSRS